MSDRTTRSATKRKRIQSATKKGELKLGTPELRTKRSRTLTNLDSQLNVLQKFRLPKRKKNCENSEIYCSSGGSEHSDRCDNDPGGSRSRLAPEDPSIENIVTALMEKRKTVRHVGTKPLSLLSGNLIHYKQNLEYGRRAPPILRQSIPATVASQVSELQLYRTASPFERRSTALEWHPTNPNLVAVASKRGEIILWDFNTINNDIYIPATGPDGSIQALKFLPHDSNRIITASVNGTVSKHVLGRNTKEVFMDTMNSYDDWYCSLDVHRERNVAVVGDNHGNVTVKSLNDGTQVFASRLHKNKVTHVEFSPREEWLLASASVDHTVQLWDIRMLKDRKSTLAVLQHDKPINSVYFSGCNGTRILTTDQHSQIRIYTAPSFQLSLTISHPHRQFQHITPIKASWHPLVDLIVVGRYPDGKSANYSPGELRTIDVLCANTGKIMCQLHDPQAKGIISLNKFSPSGDKLACGMGLNILMWGTNHDLEEKQASLLSAMKSSGLTLGGTSQNQQRKPRGTKNKKDAEKSAQAKLMLKTKTQSKKK